MFVKTKEFKHVLAACREFRKSKKDPLWITLEGSMAGLIIRSDFLHVVIEGEGRSFPPTTIEAPLVKNLPKVAKTNVELDSLGFMIGSLFYRTRAVGVRPIQAIASDDAGSLGKVNEVVPALQHVELAISGDGTRPNLTSMYLECKDPGRVVLVSTDGFRVHKTEVRVPLFSDHIKSAQISGRAIRAFLHLRHLFTGVENVVVSNDRIEAGSFFHVYDHDANSTDTEFPPYEHVIPKSYEHKIEVDGTKLLQKLKTLKKREMHEVRGVVLTAAQFKLHLECGETSVSMDAIQQNWGVRIGVNISYLVDSLKAFKDQITQIEAYGPLDPLVIECRQNHTVAVLMPMRI